MTAKHIERTTKKAHAGKLNSGKGLCSRLRLINDRNAVFMFLVLLVTILFVFDALSDQSARTTSLQKGAAQNNAVSGDLASQFMSELTVDNSRQSSDIGFIVKGSVDPQLLQYFSSMDYEQIKTQLGVQNDFVIHFEDENGQLIPIGDKWCIGSRNANVNGIACG